MVEISSEEELRAWLEGWPQEVAVAIAARAALRAKPFLALTCLEDQTPHAVVLTSFRAILIASVRAKSDTEAIRRAAAAAAAAHATAANIAAEAANTASNAAAFAAAIDNFAINAAFAAAEAAEAADALAAAEFWDAVSADATIVENGAAPVALFDRPLWHAAGMPEALQGLWAELKRYLTETDPRMRFWAEWVQRMRDGDPMDWAMQEEIALLPDEDWEAGPDRIAERIAEIQERFLAKKARVAERLDFDAEAVRFYASPVDISRPDLLVTGIARIGDALDLALKTGNGLNEASIEVQVLKLTMSKYSGDPQRAEMDCTEVHAMLTGKFTSGELPEDDPHRLLSRRLLETAEHLRAASKEIAEAREFSFEARLRALTPEQRQEMGTALQIGEVLADKTRQEFEEDRAVVENTIEVDPVYRGRLRRLVSRVTQISLLTKSKDIVDKIKNHRGFIGVDIALKIAAAGRWVVRVFYYL